MNNYVDTQYPKMVMRIESKVDGLNVELSTRLYSDDDGVSRMIVNWVSSRIFSILSFGTFPLRFELVPLAF